MDYNTLKWRGILSLFIVSVIHCIGTLYIWFVHMDTRKLTNEDLDFSWHYLDSIDTNVVFVFSPIW